MSELTATRSAEESEALRIFLRLIRPRPLADPYPLYARLRDLAPLLPVRFPGVPAGFLVSTFAGCSRLLRDPVFGPPTNDQLDVLKPGWQDNPFTRYLYRSMVFMAGTPSGSGDNRPGDQFSRHDHGYGSDDRSGMAVRPHRTHQHPGHQHWDRT